MGDNSNELRLYTIERDIEELRKRSEDADLRTAEELREFKKTYESDIKDIKQALDEARDQLGLYRHFLIVLRSLLAGILIILTLRLGDIKEVVSGLWN